MAFDNLATDAYTKWSTAVDTTQKQELDPKLKDERQRQVVEKALELIDNLGAETAPRERKIDEGVEMNALYDTDKFKQGKKIKELEKEIEDLKQENESLRNLVLEYARNIKEDDHYEDIGNSFLFYD